MRISDWSSDVCSSDLFLLIEIIIIAITASTADRNTLLCLHIIYVVSFAAIHFVDHPNKGKCANDVTPSRYNYPMTIALPICALQTEFVFIFNCSGVGTIGFAYTSNIYYNTHTN